MVYQKILFMGHVNQSRIAKYNVHLRLFFKCYQTNTIRSGTFFVNNQGHTKSESSHFSYTKHINMRKIAVNKTTRDINFR